MQKRINELRQALRLCQLAAAGDPDVVKQNCSLNDVDLDVRNGTPLPLRLSAITFIVNESLMLDSVESDPWKFETHSASEPNLFSDPEDVEDADAYETAKEIRRTAREFNEAITYAAENNIHVDFEVSDAGLVDILSIKLECLLWGKSVITSR